MQLQHWMHYSEDSLQNGLQSRSGLRMVGREIRWAYRAFVLNKHPNTMGSVFRQFLHNLRKIDSRKEITPRIFSDLFYFFFMFLPVRKSNNFDDCMFGRSRNIVLWTHRLWVLGEIDKTITEEAMISNKRVEK